MTVLKSFFGLVLALVDLVWALGFLVVSLLLILSVVVAPWGVGVAGLRVEGVVDVVITLAAVGLLVLVQRVQDEVRRGTPKRG